MNLYPLEIRFSFNQQEKVLYPVLLQADGQLILVDAGYEGALPLLEAAAFQYGLSLDKLTTLILTHHDDDHMGAAFELKTKYLRVNIYASATEAPYISGQQKSLRLQQAEDLYDSLPEDQKPGARYFQQLLRNVKPVKVDDTFGQSHSAPLPAGVQIIDTPGHMPGHISLYLKDSKTLIAADAIVYEANEFDIANPAFTLDLPEAVASVRKLQQLDLETVICYHGGIVDQEIQPKLSHLLARYPQY